MLENGETSLSSSFWKLPWIPLGTGDLLIVTHTLAFAIDLSLASNLKGILGEGECQEMKKDLIDGGGSSMFPLAMGEN